MDMLKRANRSTLVLIDELGAGTDPDEGAAIGRALLDELLRRHCRCVVSTHLGALKGYALARKGVENASVEFDAITLRPTYHLRIGEPGNSNAIEIAQRLGMHPRVVAAARRNLARKGRALQQAIAGSLDSKREAEVARGRADSARREAEDARAGADAARARFEKQQADFQVWVSRVVHLRSGDSVRVRNFDRDGRIVRMQIDQQRAEVDVGRFTVEVPLGDILPPETPAPPPRPVAPPPTVVAECKPRANRPRPPVPPAQQTQPRHQPRPPADDRHPPAPPLSDQQAGGLKSGDSIYVKRFRREGRVVRMNLAKRVASVSVGALEMELPFDGLSMPPETPRSAHPRKTPRKTGVPSSDATPKAGGASIAPSASVSVDAIPAAQVKGKQEEPESADGAAG
jgi:dsDNA-specific endonuclease/ATPase MutS2